MRKQNIFQTTSLVNFRNILYILLSEKLSKSSFEVSQLAAANGGINLHKLALFQGSWIFTEASWSRDKVLKPKLWIFFNCQIFHSRHQEFGEAIYPTIHFPA